MHEVAVDRVDVGQTCGQQRHQVQPLIAAHDHSLTTPTPTPLRTGTQSSQVKLNRFNLIKEPLRPVRTTQHASRAAAGADLQHVAGPTEHRCRLPSGIYRRRDGARLRPLIRPSSAPYYQYTKRVRGIKQISVIYYTRVIHTIDSGAMCRSFLINQYRLSVQMECAGTVCIWGELIHGISIYLPGSTFTSIWKMCIMYSICLKERERQREYEYNIIRTAAT